MINHPIDSSLRNITELKNIIRLWRSQEVNVSYIYKYLNISPVLAHSVYNRLTNNDFKNLQRIHGRKNITYHVITEPNKKDKLKRFHESIDKIKNSKATKKIVKEAVSNTGVLF